MQKKFKKKSIFRTLKKNIVAIPAVAIVSVIITIFYASLFMTPLYTSSAAVCLKYDTNSDATCEDPDKHVSNNIEEFIFLICTDDVKEKAEKDLSKTETKYKSVNIESVKIEANQLDDSNIVYINITSKNAQLSCDLCDVYTKIATNKVSEVGNISASVVEKPMVSKEPSSPMILENCIIVAVATSVLTVLFIIVKSLLNGKMIKSGKEVESEMDILFLGDIPDVNVKESNKFVKKTDSDKIGFKE